MSAMTTKNKHGAFEPFHIDNVPWEEFTHGRFGMRYKPLGDFAGASKLGVCWEELAPGQQANQSHYHYLEEEHLLVLSGELTLQLNDCAYSLTEGYYVCFPAGQTVGHSIRNDSSEVCRYLVFSSRDPNDVMVYPDGDKIKVKATGEIYQKSHTLNYWDNINE